MSKKHEDAFIHLINKMLEVAGYKITYTDLLTEEDGWYSRYTWSKEQYEEFEVYAIQYLRKKLRINKGRAGKEVGWFLFAYGLSTKDNT
jgi:hypothetical protein